MRKRYPSDMSREHFEKIKLIVLTARKNTRPRKLDLYEVFCAVLYVLKTGCPWRALPNDFPKWRSVPAYFQIWSEKQANQPSILERVLKKMCWRGRYQHGSDREN